MHANKEKEISGSYHASQNLLRDVDLQIDAVAVCCAVVIETFGRQRWYQKVMEYYDLEENRHLKRFLFPGTPCTGFWWSCDDCAFNKHIDRNAYGVAFVFSTYGGGDLTFVHLSMPDIECSHHLELGEVVAGRWSRGPHYIQKCKKGEVRSVIVLYGDYRILEKKGYVHIENKSTTTLQNITCMEL